MLYRQLATLVPAGLLLTLLVSVQHPATAADPKEEAKLFQGKWKVWRSESNGNTVAASGDGMLIEGNTIQFLWGGDNKGATARFTVNPAAEPKEIEVEFTSGSSNRKKQVGIYRFSQEGQLEISWAEVGSDKRPSKFSGKVTTGVGKPYNIYRSDKYKQPEAVTKEFKTLEGKWKMVEYHRFGRAEANAPGRNESVVIEGDEFQYYWGGNNKGAKAKFLVDPTGDPRQIEIICIQGSDNGKKSLGIYRLTGNKLEISVGEPNSEVRPTAFSGVKGTPGAGAAFWVYERVKE
jgi:uncharacterized protein (TIGR03067 family)